MTLGLSTQLENMSMKITQGYSMKIKSTSWTIIIQKSLTLRRISGHPGQPHSPPMTPWAACWAGETLWYWLEALSKMDKMISRWPLRCLIFPLRLGDLSPHQLLLWSTGLAALCCPMRKFSSWVLAMILTKLLPLFTMWIKMNGGKLEIQLMTDVGRVWLSSDQECSLSEAWRTRQLSKSSTWRQSPGSSPTRASSSRETLTRWFLCRQISSLTYLVVVVELLEISECRSTPISPSVTFWEPF